MRRLLLAGLALAVAACGTDKPGLGGAAPAATSPTTVAGGGPAVRVATVGAVEAPVIVDGAAGAAATAAARVVATKLGSGGRTCPVRVVASTPRVVSLRWDCTDRTVATATFSVATGRQLSLGDVLQGGWLAYLSTTAQAQLEAGGASAAAAAAAAPATADAYQRWSVTGADLQVVVSQPAHEVTVSFPLSTLGPYLRPGVL